MFFSFQTLITILTLIKIVCGLENTSQNPVPVLPEEYIQGVVLMVMGKCKHSKKLMDFVSKYNIPHKAVYLENDEKARDFIMKNYDGKIPWVFQDGNVIGDGYAFIEKYQKDNNLPVTTKTSSLIEQDKINTKTNE